MVTGAASPGWWSRTRGLLAPEPAPVLLRTGAFVVVDMAVVFASVRAVLAARGYPEAGLTHAVLPAVFAGMFAGIGSLGGHLRGGLVRAILFSAAAFVFTLIAIDVRPVPVASALALGCITLATGMMAWYGEPLATMGSLLLYSFFVPLVFGAGEGVPVGDLAISFAVMLACTLLLRALVALLPARFHDVPMRVKATDDAPAVRVGHRYRQVPQPRLGMLHRTTARSALALGIGAFVMSATRDHNAVWVLMTLIALVPPYLALTWSRLFQRLAGTVLAMVVLTAVDALVPPGPLRLLLLVPGLVLTIAYLRRSYAISVLGISTVAVLSYAQVHVPLGEALLYRGLDTLVGAVIAVVVVAVIPSTSRRATASAGPAQAARPTPA